MFKMLLASLRKLEDETYLEPESLFESWSFDVENSLLDWDWQGILKTNNHIHRLLGNGLSLKLEFDIGLSHTEIILGKVIVVGVLHLS